MKKLILLVLSVTLLASCVEQRKYTIDTPTGSYSTDNYVEQNGCIMFKSDCGCGGEPESIKVCGNYSIRKNNYDKVD